MAGERNCYNRRNLSHSRSVEGIYYIAFYSICLFFIIMHDASHFLGRWALVGVTSRASMKV